jgi:hypothetical protein
MKPSSAASLACPGTIIAGVGKRNFGRWVRGRPSVAEPAELTSGDAARQLRSAVAAAGEPARGSPRPCARRPRTAGSARQAGPLRSAVRCRPISPRRLRARCSLLGPVLRAACHFSPAQSKLPRRRSASARASPTPLRLSGLTSLAAAQRPTGQMPLLCFSLITSTSTYLDSGSKKGGLLPILRWPIDSFSRPWLFKLHDATCLHDTTRGPILHPQTQAVQDTFPPPAGAPGRLVDGI